MTVEKATLSRKNGKAASNLGRRSEKPELVTVAQPGIAPGVDRAAKSVIPPPTAILPQVSTDVIAESVTSAIVDPASLLFDPDWYCINYPDVVAAGLDPVRHFFDNGAREVRKPNRHFETSWYLSANADVAASKMNPFLHYLFYGAREGRKPRP